MARQGWTIDIEAPAERIFAYLTEPALTKRWLRGSVAYEVLTKEKGGVGARVRTRTEVNGYQKVVEQEIVRLEPNRLIETRCRCRITNQGRALPAFSFRQSYELIDHGNRCTLIWRYTPGGFSRLWAAWARWLYGVEREPAQAELEQLKNAIEGEDRAEGRSPPL